MKIYIKYRIISPLHYFMNRPTVLIHSYFRLIKPQISCFRWRLLLTSKNKQEKLAWISRGLPLRFLRNFRDERSWFALCVSPLAVTTSILHAPEGNRSKDTERRKDSDLAVSMISLTPRRSITFDKTDLGFIKLIEPILLMYEVNPGHSTHV